MPFESNIINVGVENSFYSQGEDTDADDSITRIEGSLRELVHDLTEVKPGVVEDPRLPQLVAHLEVRTRHLRQSFSEAAHHLVAMFIDFMADENSFVEWLERRLRNDPSLLRDSLSRELAERGLPQEWVEPALRLCTPLLPVFLDQMRPSLPMMAQQLRDVMHKGLTDAAKSGHIRALKMATVPEVRIEWYRHLTFAVMEWPQGDLILGDSAVLFQLQGPRLFKPLVGEDDQMTQVYLPLGPGRIIVGSREDSLNLPPALVRAIARCSYEYFIASENTTPNTLLADQIGEDSYFVSKTDLDAIFKDSISK